MKVLSFGEIIWDVYPDEKHLGGAPLNFAAHFAKQGGEAYMLSALGDDELGKEALNKLSLWKVNAEYVSVLSGKDTGNISGCYAALLRECLCGCNRII